MAELGLVSNAVEALSWFEKPEQYNGLAVKKAKTLAAKYKKLIH
jgi:adenylosuccinate lyase